MISGTGRWLLMCLMAIGWSSVAYSEDFPKDVFVPLFDGKSMDGWEVVGKEGSVWKVEDGALAGSGEASMLVCTKGPFNDFRYRAEIKISDKGNSGMYFRTTRKPVFSDGYEAQINSTAKDSILTGSIYNYCHVYKRWVEPDTWFNYEVQVRDDVWRGKPVTKIKVTVNGTELYELNEFSKAWGAG